LDIVGVGFRAELKRTRVFTLGFSHPLEYPLPAGISATIDKQTHLVLTGVDRQLIGQMPQIMRRTKKPDPYKQKGIRLYG
jgi:large subunit ribosomal protein L6